MSKSMFKKHKEGRECNRENNIYEDFTHLNHSFWSFVFFCTVEWRVENTLISETSEVNATQAIEYY